MRQLPVILLNWATTVALLTSVQTAQAGLFDDLKSLGDKAKVLLTAEPSSPGQEALPDLLSETAPASAEEKPQSAQPEQADALKSEKKAIKTPRSYSLFYDQGDHLAELIKAGQFEDAEQLFIAHKTGFFDQIGGLDRKPRIEKYAAELRQLADALNAPQKIQLRTLSSQLLEAVETPHSETRWAAWRALLQEARSAVTKYRAHPLLGLPIYQDASLTHLESTIAQAEKRIQDRAIEVVLQNPPDLAASWLSSSYPGHIDMNDLVNRQSARVLEMLSNKSKQDVVAFHRIFGSQFGDGMLRNVGDLLLDKHEIKGVGDTRLRQAMKAYQDVKALGLKPSTLRGLSMLYAERSDHKNNALKFGSRLHPDIPLETKTIEFDSLSDKLDGNFLIVLDLTKSEVQRKEGWLKRVRSQYLSGHRNIPNPKYAEAKAAYERARSAHDNANSQDCSRDRGFGCAIAKTILVAAAGTSMAEAQKKVYSMPEFLSEPIYRNYDYRTSKVEIKKNLTGKAYFIDLGALIYQVIPVEMTESASFPLVHELSAEDTHYASIVAAHKNEQDIDHHADQPMEIKLSALVDTYLGEGSRSFALSSLDQLMAAMVSGAPATAVAAAPRPVQPMPPLVTDDSVRKLQAELLAQREKIKVQSQLERLKTEIARLEESATDKFNEDLHEKLTTSRSAQKQPNLHVLSVGINNYADVPDVPYAERSAQLFAELAKKTLGAKDENVLLLTDADATSGRLRGRLRTLLSRLDANDHLIIYYAGHGVPSKDGKSAYLLAQDGGPGSFEEPDLQLDTLYAQIEKSRVGHASVFIDACFSGRSGKDTIVFEGVGGITLVPRAGVSPNGRLSVITAGRSDQFSNQDKAHGHRLFGYHLMKSMLETPDNLSMTNLYERVRERVRSDSRRIGPEFEQEPELLGNIKGVVGR